MVGARRRVRVSNQGYIALPADVLHRHNLKDGDEVGLEETDRGVLITPQVEDEAMSRDRDSDMAKSSPEELARRKAAVDRILAVRAQTPSIAPYTTADLVHLAREDSSWYGDNAEQD